MKYRYRKEEEMKDSGVEWIDKVPHSWVKNKLKRELEFSVGGTPATSNSSFFEGENIWVTISDLDGKYCGSSKTKISDEAVITSKIKKVPKDSLLYSFKLSVGQMAFTTTEVYTNEAIAAFVPNGNYNLKFWYYGLGEYLIKNANENIYGAKLLNQELINNAVVFTPNKREQEKIANFLDEKTAQFDSIISKKEALIERLEEAKKSLISEVVTGKVKVVKTNEGYELVERKKEEMKDSGVEWLGLVPVEWTIMKLARVANIVRGASPRPAGDPIYFGGNDVPWITVAEVTKDENKYLTSVSSYLTDLGKKQSRYLKKGTLVMSNSGATLGVPKILDIEGCINDGSLAFLNLISDKSYIYYLLKSRTKIFREEMQISGQPNLNTEIVKRLDITQPDIDEQKKIADFLDEKTVDINVSVEKVKLQIEKLKEAKQSLISEAITGKIEILD